jgi:hypothetical protein
MKNLSTDAAQVKLMLLIAIGLYALVLAVFLFNYGGLKQNIYEEFIR